jgi:hypothetical protein
MTMQAHKVRAMSNVQGHGKLARATKHRETLVGKRKPPRLIIAVKR